MKPSPDEQRILRRMAPGELCAEGFLGDDRRTLGEILDADRGAVEALGVTHQQIADKLREAMDAATAALGRPVRVSADVTAVWREAMGKTPCPFADGMFPKGDIELANDRTGRTLRFSPLSVHLIARHGFYQGRGSRYRLEPETVCRFFDLL